MEEARASKKNMTDEQVMKQLQTAFAKRNLTLE
jgi:hypothetical protein